MHDLGVQWINAVKNRTPIRFPIWEDLFQYVASTNLGDDIDASMLRLLPATGLVVETDPLIRRNMAFLMITTNYYTFVFGGNPSFQRLFGPVEQLLRDRGWWDNQGALWEALDDGSWEKYGEEIAAKLQSAAARDPMMPAIVKLQYGDDIFDKIKAERAL